MICCHENETSHLHEHQYDLNVTLTFGQPKVLPAEQHVIHVRGTAHFFLITNQPDIHSFSLPPRFSGFCTAAHKSPAKADVGIQYHVRQFDNCS